MKAKRMVLRESADGFLSVDYVYEDVKTHRKCDHTGSTVAPFKAQRQRIDYRQRSVPTRKVGQRVQFHGNNEVRSRLESLECGIY